MRAAYAILVLSSVACLLAGPLLLESASPLPLGEGAAVDAASPLPRGEDVARPVLSSAGAARVRGLSAKPSRIVNRSTPSLNIHTRSTRASASKVHPPGTNKTVGAAKTVTQTAAARTDNVRHRSPNPAIVGGPAKTEAKATNSLSGTGMSRRR